MEIENIRKELTQLLNSIVEHSERYSEERPIPSLEISFVLTKINKMQENLVVLRHLLKEKELAAMKNKRQQKAPRVIKEKVEPETIADPQSVEKATELDSLLKSSISKLVDALTLNDRYLYANELFDKDMSAFNDLIKLLDNCGSLEEAKELLPTEEWDDENEHVLSFQDLVERRFTS